MAKSSSALAKPERVTAVIRNDELLRHCSNSKVPVSQRAAPAISPGITAKMKSQSFARGLGERSTKTTTKKSTMASNARIAVSSDAH